MNYLAHIHLAHVSQTSLLGNFLGDFVKGSYLQHLPVPIQDGVRLHRKIDSFTDNHSIVTSMRSAFPKDLRRISGVIIDIYFDHLLCVHWQQFTEEPKQEVLTGFYEQLEVDSLNIDQHYANVRAGLLEHQWLNTYENRKSCLNAFEQIEKRLKMRLIFAHKGYAFINSHHAEIEQKFLAFYPELIRFVQHTKLQKDSYNVSTRN